MTDRAGPRPDRRGVTLALGAAVGLAAAGPAAAQIAGLEVIAAGPPGDGQDQLARAIAEGLALTKLTPRAMAVNTSRDVQALLDFTGGKRPRAALMIVGLSTLGVLESARQASLVDQCRPLCRVLGEHLPLVVPAESRFRALPDLMEAIGRDAGSVAWAGRDRGTADHLLCLQLTKAAGGDVTRVDYRPFVTAAEASNHVLKGEVAVGVGALIEFVAQIRGGTLRALGVASPERAVGIDIPTLREQGADVAQLNWRGVVSRDSVGRTLIDRYGEAIARVVRTPGWGELMKHRFWVDMYQPSSDFAAFLDDEQKRVRAVLGEAGTTAR